MIICLKILGAGIQVDVILTLAMYLNIVADPVDPIMAAVFPNGGGFFQQ